uniref:R-spondin 3 n=1 Tax=Gouania willdenowi TaxID=441366 RepID=A0A8C5NES6_GOUWI
ISFQLYLISLLRANPILKKSPFFPMERCKSDCASCFSENFCTHCHPGHFLFRGRCYATCPKGLMPNPALRECTGRTTALLTCETKMKFLEDMFFLHGQCHHSCPAGFEPDWQLVKLHCEVGEWSDWGPCLQKQGLRAYRKGQETRTRQVLQNPSVHGNTCPHLSEFRKCVFKKRQGSTLNTQNDSKKHTKQQLTQMFTIKVAHLFFLT